MGGRTIVPNVQSFKQDAITVTLEISGAKRRLLVDTGAGISILSAPVRDVPLRRTDIQAQGVTGQPLRILGTQECLVRCGTGSVKVKFLVAPMKIQFDGILGLRALAKIGWNIDTRRGTVYVPGPVVGGEEVVPVVQSDKGTEVCERESSSDVTLKPETGLDGARLNCAVGVSSETRGVLRAEGPCKDVRCVARVQIGPREEQVVSAFVETPEGLQGESVYFSPRGARENSCLALGHSVNVVDNGRILIRVVNVGLQPVELRRGEALGTVSTLARRGLVVGSVEGSSPKDRRGANWLAAGGARNWETKLDHLRDDDRAAIAELIEEYSDLFQSPDADALGCTAKITHRIDTGEAAPIAKAPYRVPHSLKSTMKTMIKDMLSKGIITPSMSPWSAPVVLVRKKDGSHRFCTDFRGLNSVTKIPAYPLPNIQETLEGLGNSRYFTTLDLASGYHQIMIDEGDQWKTGFSTPEGHYEYKRMAFGLAGAPATFQLLMDRLLADLKGTTCLVYLDDVIIHSSTISEHKQRLRGVFDKLREANLKVNLNKCQFAEAQVHYLGHVVSERGVQPDPTKLKAIKEYPRPKSVRELRAYLGLVGYYRRFIASFADVAKPLTTLTKQGQPFTWGTEQEEAYRNLRDALCGDSVLIYPDFSAPFILSTDASTVGLGAILSQIVGGQERPVAYASRQLNKAESRYSATHLEMLAVVWGIQHFRCYLYGRKFKLITDHSALRWLLTLKDPSSRLSRWQLRLAEYDYEVFHKPGKNHGNVDALSRHAVGSIQTPSLASPGFLAFKLDQENDPECRRLTDQNPERYHKDARGLWYYKGREGTSEPKLLVPASRRRQVMLENHDSPAAGHPGVDRTVAIVEKDHYWPSLRGDCREYVEQCRMCQQRKTPTGLKAPMGTPYVPKAPLDQVGLDIVGPLPATASGARYLLTFVDHLTRYAEAEPVKGISAAEVGEVFVKKMVARHGCPGRLLTDRGANFTSTLMRRVCELLGVKQIFTTAYHPQSNGRVERFHKTLINSMACYVRRDGYDWDAWVPYAVMAYNATPHSATGFTPNYLMFGREISKPTSFILRPEGQASNPHFVTDLKAKLETAHEQARQTTAAQFVRQAHYYDLRTKDRSFDEGEWVFFKHPVPKEGESSKFHLPWKGPFRVEEKLSDLLYRIRLSNGECPVVNINRLKPFKGEPEPESEARERIGEERDGELEPTIAEDEVPGWPWWDGTLPGSGEAAEEAVEVNTPTEDVGPGIIEADDAGLGSPASPFDDTRRDPTYTDDAGEPPQPRSPYLLRSRR